MKLWDEVAALERRLVDVEKVVRRLSQPLPARARETMTVIQQEIAIDAYDLSEQQATFRNGDRDTIVVQRLACAVSKNPEPSSETYERLPLEKTPEGWHRRDLDYSILDSEFDFLWNYQVASRQAFYSRDFLTSDSLVGLDKGQMLDLRVPLVLPRGEMVTFYVRPQMFAIPSSSAAVTVGSSVYYVSFLGLGYRGGEG